MPVTWTEYLNVPDAGRRYFQCRLLCRESFSQQRGNIQRVIEATSPKVVACLGAGVLNDIPYRLLIQSGATIHLVDWLTGSIQEGIRLSLIEVDEDGQPSCIYCEPTVTDPRQHCTWYQRSTESTSQVCDHFVPCPGDPLTCAAFAAGKLPAIHCSDVTAGYAGEFGRRLSGALQGVRSWEQAFSKAIRVADRLRNHRVALPISESSVDLVTSSMVVSQFVHEPYTFFSCRTAEVLGPPKHEDEDRLRPMMRRLCSTLFRHQVQGHCEEIARILTPNGLCYMSFELFHGIPQSRTWHLVEGVANVLEVLNRFFFFNFDHVTESDSLTRFRAKDETSLVFSVVLESKKQS